MMKISIGFVILRPQGSFHDRPPGPWLHPKLLSSTYPLHSHIIARSPDRFVNVGGIDHHQIVNIPIVTCGAHTVTCNHGPVIVIFHQFSGMMRGRSILSSPQLEAYHNHVNDRSRLIDHRGQLITTNDGFEFPLHIRNGLPYLELRPYTNAEWDRYPHVVMTFKILTADTNRIVYRSLTTGSMTRSMGRHPPESSFQQRS
jgi:hypothetical protein